LNQVHAIVFGDFDFQHLSATCDAMDANLARLSASAIQATNPAQEAKTLLQPEEDVVEEGPDDAKEEAAQARLEEIENLKVTRKRLKSYMKLMHRGDIQSLARLVFVTTHDNMSEKVQRNDILLGLHGQGAVAPGEMEKALREVHGGDFKLREPPKEKKDKVPPKKKKAKKKAKKAKKPEKKEKQGVKRKRDDEDKGEGERKPKRQKKSSDDSDSDSESEKKKRKREGEDKAEGERKAKRQKKNSSSDSDDSSDSDSSDDDSDSEDEKKKKSKKKDAKKK
jgi:hypothetical protein